MPESNQLCRLDSAEKRRNFMSKEQKNYRVDPKSIVKNKKYSFRVTDDEYEKIEKKIQESKLSITEFMTKAALNQKIVVIDDLKELVLEVNRIGVNLNQLTKLANQGKIDAGDELATINEEMVEVWQLLRQLIRKQA